MSCELPEAIGALICKEDQASHTSRITCTSLRWSVCLTPTCKRYSLTAMVDWLQAYAMTEASHQMTSNPLPKHGPHKAGTVGRAQGSVKVVFPSYTHIHPCRRILISSLSACHKCSAISATSVVGCDMVSAPLSVSVDVKSNLTCCCGPGMLANAAFLHSVHCRQKLVCRVTSASHQMNALCVD